VNELLQGNAACARAALDAGCTFFAGYPITPSSEIAEQMAAALPKRGGVFVQMEDEIASLGAVLGASLAGRRAMTATSGPGFSLMQEHLGYGMYAEIPCVVVDVMRGGPSTGLPTRPSQGDVMQARWGTHGDHPAIALAPASVAEVYELTARAFELSDRLRTPVVLLYDEVIGHLRERVDLAPVSPPPAARAGPDGRSPYAAGEDDVARLPDLGSGQRFHVTGLGHGKRGYPTDDPTVVGDLALRLARKVERARAEIAWAETYRTEDADLVVVAYGIVARAARRAVDDGRARGMRLGLFRPRTIWPFPAEAFRAATAGARGVLVAEMNLGQLAVEIERYVPRGSVATLLRADGRPIAPEEIVAAAVRVTDSERVVA